MKPPITVESIINAPIENIWSYWTLPAHITKWNNASPDWHTPRAENDLVVGGKFLSRMESKDGKIGFDFTGTYTEVVPNEKIVYVMEDGRKVMVQFIKEGEVSKIIETFDPEDESPIEMQQAGWQAILNNFKRYVEGN